MQGLEGSALLAQEDRIHVKSRKKDQEFVKQVP